MSTSPILFLFNAPIASGCDYVTQTMRLVAKGHPSVGLALGDIIFFPKLFTERNPWITRSIHGAIIMRPVSVLPGIRFRWVRMVTYVGSSLFLLLYMALRYFGRKKVLWFFEPFHIPPLSRIFQSYVSVYDCVDYYPGFSEAANREHTMVMKSAQYVVANSDSLVKELKKVRADAVRVPLGFADELFSDNVLRTRHRRKRDGFTVGYVGSISGRMDFSLIEKAAADLPTTRFVFVGPIEANVFGGQDDVVNIWRRICRLKNISWRQQVSKDAIPAVLSGFDVGIIPYKIDNLFNRFSFPMKTMEYFAAGLPVISTEIFSLRRYKQLGLVRFVTSESDFTHEIVRLTKADRPYKHTSVGQNIAKDQSWSTKVKRVLEILSDDTSLSL